MIKHSGENKNIKQPKALRRVPKKKNSGLLSSATVTVTCNPKISSVTSWAHKKRKHRYVAGNFIHTARALNGYFKVTWRNFGHETHF